MQERELSDGTILKMSTCHYDGVEAQIMNRPVGSYEGTLTLKVEDLIIGTNHEASRHYPEQQFEEIYRSIRNLNDFLVVKRHFLKLLEKER